MSALESLHRRILELELRLNEIEDEPARSLRALQRDYEILDQQSARILEHLGLPRVAEEEIDAELEAEQVAWEQDGPARQHYERWKARAEREKLLPTKLNERLARIEKRLIKHRNEGSDLAGLVRGHRALQEELTSMVAHE